MENQQSILSTLGLSLDQMIADTENDIKRERSRHVVATRNLEQKQKKTAEAKMLLILEQASSSAAMLAYQHTLERLLSYKRFLEGQKSV